MQDIDPRMLAAIVAMMQQEGQYPNAVDSGNPMPPAQGTYADPLGAMSVGAVSGATAGGIPGGLPGAIGGAGLGGLVGLIASYLEAHGPAAKRTQAYNNEYGPGNQIR